MSWPETPPTAPPAQPPTVPSSALPQAPGATGDIAPTGRTAASGPRAAGTPPRRARTVIGIVLLFVAGLSAALGISSFWTANAILDEGTWVATSEAIVNNPNVQQDVANALATQVVDLVGVDELVSGVLPGPLSGFSGTLTQKVTDLVALATIQVVRTDAFITVWEAAVRATHDEFVHAVNGSTRYLSIDSKGLSLDLGASLAEITKQLDQRGIRVLDNINPASINLQLPLIDAPGLERIQTWVRALRVGAIVFPAIAVITLIAGLLIARRRSFAIIAGAVGTLAGAGIVWFIASSGREQSIERISGGVLGVASAGVIVDEVLSGLKNALLVTCAVAFGVLVLGAVAAVLATRRDAARADDSTAPAV